MKKVTTASGTISLLRTLGKVLNTYKSVLTNKVAGIEIALWKPIIVYKKVSHGSSFLPTIATLRLPAGAVVIKGNDTSLKLRANKAEVVSMQLISQRKQAGKTVQQARSMHDNGFIYRVGRKVKPVSDFSRNFGACASGIHFFLDKASAKAY